MTLNTPQQGPAGPGRSDHAPGMRTLAIPHMKAHGWAPAEISAITHVPPALVELIPAQPCTAHGATVPPPSPARPSWYRRHRKFVIWAATAAFLVAATAVSIVLRAPLLPLAAMVIGGWLGPRRI
ncbi:hypothetical protein AL755_13930 [Arthrobacter sp. ERGS1:01]|uniref:hypothetical protein n=1 Tax=Arthrobacter sp. ERGS1:01 TaxID=1704044 RepID=UPI0006B5CE11|nr:hypothetical protein [Arthrobacter sp. ERGS1:01]ALE06306.1 hypothetical protein AL755_13930 [Arthrobacter sp. ERGS1:01]